MGQTISWDIIGGNIEVDNAVHTITAAMLGRMEQEIAQLRKEFATCKSQIETQQITTTTMSTLVTRFTDVKSAMAMVKNGGTTSQPIITNGTIAKRDRKKPRDGGFSRKPRGFFNLGHGNGSGPSGNGNDLDDGDGVHTSNRVQDGREDRGREFVFLKSSSIIIQTFSGKNLSSNPYLPFNTSLKGFIYNQRADGD